MSIAQKVEKGKINLKQWLLVGFSSFISVLITALCLGGYTFHELKLLRVPITVDPAPPLLQAPTSTPAVSAANTRPKIKLFVASRRGKSYYSLGCKGGTTIPPENQVWFETEVEAKAAGFTASKSCKDLK
jgi:hypothetical protein